MPPKSGPKSKRGSNSSSKKQPKTVKDARKTPKASASSSSSNSSRGSQDPLFVAPVEAQTVTRGIGSGRRRDIRVAAVPTQRFEPHAEGNESSSLSSVRDHERQSSDRPPSRTPLPLSFTFTGEDLRIEGDNVVEVDRSDVMTIFYNEDGISSASHTVTTKYKMGPPSSTESDLSLSRSQRPAVLNNSSTSRRSSFSITGKNICFGEKVVKVGRSEFLIIGEQEYVPVASHSVTTTAYRLDPSPSSPPPMADPEDEDEDGDDGDDDQDDDQESQQPQIKEE